MNANEPISNKANMVTVMDSIIPFAEIALYKRNPLKLAKSTPTMTVTIIADKPRLALYFIKKACL